MLIYNPFQKVATIPLLKNKTEKYKNINIERNNEGGSPF